MRALLPLVVLAGCGAGARSSLEPVRVERTFWYGVPEGELDADVILSKQDFVWRNEAFPVDRARAWIEARSVR